MSQFLDVAIFALLLLAFACCAFACWVMVKLRRALTQLEQSLDSLETALVSLETALVPLVDLLTVHAYLQVKDSPNLEMPLELEKKALEAAGRLGQKQLTMSGGKG